MLDQGSRQDDEIAFQFDFGSQVDVIDCHSRASVCFEGNFGRSLRIIADEVDAVRHCFLVETLVFAGCLNVAEKYGHVNIWIQFLELQSVTEGYMAAYPSAIRSARFLSCSHTLDHDNLRLLQFSLSEKLFEFELRDDVWAFVVSVHSCGFELLGSGGHDYCAHLDSLRLIRVLRLQGHVKVANETAHFMNKCRHMQVYFAVGLHSYYGFSENF